MYTTATLSGLSSRDCAQHLRRQRAGYGDVLMQVQESATSRRAVGAAATRRDASATRAATKTTTRPPTTTLEPHGVWVRLRVG